LGAQVELHFLDAPLAELRRRLVERKAELGERTLHVEVDALELWSTWLERPGADELGLVIEPATPEDVAALPAVERDASTLFAEWPEPLALPGEPSDLDELAEAQRAGRLWVARAASGDVAGFAQADLVAGEPHLEELDVARAYSRLGIGRRLLDAVKAWARAQGHRSLTLTTFRDLPWNAPFYARCGFRVLAAEDLSPALRAVVDDETARGLDPKQRVVMRGAV
jgi:GNAT superfamily N-acetyltransferase